MSQIVTSFAEISAQYDVAFVDLWGCVHNGITAYPDAVAALQSYRAAGGIVVLVTNSPRPWDSVAKQISDMGAPDDCWDAIATSGDSARAAMFRGIVGEKVYFMGETPRDDDFFKPLSIIDSPVDIQKVTLDQAEGIVCCGPFDTQADVDVNRADFLYAKSKGLKLLCANPDIIVDRGETREWCAGALAALYTEMGGESLYFGKPHPPIYDLARRRYAALAGSLSDPRIIAIGDGIRTDILGGQQEDIDTLFITGGLSAEETKTVQQPDEDALNAYIIAEMVTPTYSIGFLK
ncbi:TIGR01459 family HAD-type hydrolase [Octadecabacter sp. 1_MG-2023]|uniref:TIGR01459 family HAD-type hydrolase n=1 Tax=unclassified Octadecabacter TaxID=196158 RepID=UPI001C08C6F9|nr:MULTISPECIES: TIGR01459 family HAD-type hydrolase [unclassified Octadecabacter]MBU2991925.1 TIGR01459 family HAD-type hydrolase [Octadecabacter sp. B2R22]MDO6735899.1 TIGR01459 family HAD-type hydrolase [Octadecabacter sp. 1_MG-2023]